MFDDEPPKKKQTQWPDLSDYSVADLDVYLDELKAEMARVEADKAKKSDYAATADQFFKGAGE